MGAFLEEVHVVLFKLFFELIIIFKKRLLGMQASDGNTILETFFNLF